MIPAHVIGRKRDGLPADLEELAAFFAGYLADEVSDAQLAAFLMASHFKGLSAGETGVLLDSMVGSGALLEWESGGPFIDKHSTGGVGDKVSLALSPLVASLGVSVPMMSGRGLGHTGGTLDKLAAIPGFKTRLTLAEFRNVLERVGCAMIGQGPEIAPLDGRIYALRDVTATVPIIPVIAASIMSKKLAEGLDGLLLDVKVGSGAFIPEEDRALLLATVMIELGNARGLPARALLTAMDRPLGRAVGNALETREAIACLRGGGPADFRELVIRQSAEMLVLAEGAEWSAEAVRAAVRRSEAALDDGRALEKMAELIEAQGGDARALDRPELLPSAPCVREVRARRSGLVISVEPRRLGEGVVALGGGRRSVEDEIDLGVGFELGARPGDLLEEGGLLARVHAADQAGLDLGEAVARAAVRTAAAAEPSGGELYAEGELRALPLVSWVVDGSGARRDPL